MTMELITPYRAAAMDMGTLNCPTFIGHLVVEHGTLPMDELYEALRMASANAGVLDYDWLQANQPQSDSGDGFQLYAIGDAVSCRNIYAAIYDALPLCKDL